MLNSSTTSPVCMTMSVRLSAKVPDYRHIDKAPQTGNSYLAQNLGVIAKHTNRQTDGWADRCYQVYELTAL